MPDVMKKGNRRGRFMDKTSFFLTCFWLIRSSFLYLFPSAAPQRTANSEVPSQMAAYPRTGSPV